MHRPAPYSSPHPAAKSGRAVSRIPTTNPSNMSNVSNEMDLCNYSSHLCRREKLSGFDFCLRHILEDKNAPYKQCNFHFRSQRRCPRAAPKTDKKDGWEQQFLQVLFVLIVAIKILIIWIFHSIFINTLFMVLVVGKNSFKRIRTDKFFTFKIARMVICWHLLNFNL